MAPQSWWYHPVVSWKTWEKKWNCRIHRSMAKGQSSSFPAHLLGPIGKEREKRLKLARPLPHQVYQTDTVVDGIESEEITKEQRQSKTAWMKLAVICFVQTCRSDWGEGAAETRKQFQLQLLQFKRIKGLWRTALGGMRGPLPFGCHLWPGKCTIHFV